LTLFRSKEFSSCSKSPPSLSQTRVQPFTFPPSLDIRLFWFSDSEKCPSLQQTISFLNEGSDWSVMMVINRISPSFRSRYVKGIERLFEVKVAHKSRWDLAWRRVCLNSFQTVTVRGLGILPIWSRWNHLLVNPDHEVRCPGDAIVSLVALDEEGQLVLGAYLVPLYLPW
jgi:hypothetical protein